MAVLAWRYDAFMSAPIKHNGVDVRKDTRWRHPSFRGVWTVQSAGPRNVTLKGNVTLGTMTVATERFCAADSQWAPAN